MKCSSGGKKIKIDRMFGAVKKNWLKFKYPTGGVF